VPDLRQALEAALLEGPDDLASYAAYADYLAEQGDVRGEFIQVQLALEDPSIPAPQRQKLRARERRLLQKHERDWLGGLARWLLDRDASEFVSDSYQDSARYAHSWHRGFLGRVEVAEISRRFAQALATAPAARLLRELVIEHDPTHWEDLETDPPRPRTRTPVVAQRHQAVHELIRAPCLRNLRVFQVGYSPDETGETSCFNYTPALEEVIRGMPRIEELRLFTKDYDSGVVFGLRSLTHLRVLWADHLHEYPLERLAANPALANLTSLGFHPHFSDDYYGETDHGQLPLSSFEALLRSRHLKKVTHLRFRCSSLGDEGVRLLIGSGWLKTLEVLDLRHGRITDEGARLLASCPDLKNLDLLDLAGNQLTAEGVRALRRTKVRLRCDGQDEEGSLKYLAQGDFE
jgi:uncharacterized protein (TIGR02996 family)